MAKSYSPHDAWTQKAQKEGYRARSVYKLQELDEKYHFLHPGMRVLDVGAAPGSWLQYISKKISPSTGSESLQQAGSGQTGVALGLDIQKIELVADNIITKICDVMQSDEVEKSIRELGWNGVDLIVSDVMQNTTGIKIVDRQNSIDLSRQVFEIAKKYLKPRKEWDGYLVMKIFEGENFKKLLQELRRYFAQVKIEKPKVSRARSKEIYIVCSRHNPRTR